MLRSALKVLVLAAALGAPAAVASSQPAQAEIIAVHDSRHDRHEWRSRHHHWRHDRHHYDRHRGDWHRHGWHRGYHRPAWHWCYDRWGRAYACR